MRNNLQYMHDFSNNTIPQPLEMKSTLNQNHEQQFLKPKFNQHNSKMRTDSNKWKN